MIQHSNGNLSSALCYGGSSNGLITYYRPKASGDWYLNAMYVGDQLKVSCCVNSLLEGLALIPVTKEAFDKGNW